MLRYCRQWPRRVWAVEGAGGVGRPLAQRLLAEGERVLDVPAKLSARVRVLDKGHGRKTDATDAHAVVMAALRDRNQLRELSLAEDLVVLRLLADRRDELSRSRAQGLNRLHRLMTELVPGGIPTKKSVPQYQTMLAGVRPRDAIGRTVRRLAADQLADLVRSDVRLKAVKAELKQAVLAAGSQLMDLHGIGPAGAARILADVGDVRRFPDRNHFASWTGTAPLDASSGQQIRHRLSRGGNRRLNHVLYIAAFVQLRHDTAGRAYYRRKLAAGKTPHGSHALPEATLVRRGLPAAARRQPAQRPSGRGGPGRAQRGDTHIQRGRPDPAHRHFGSATTRARTTDATRPTTDPTPLPGLPRSTTPPAPEARPLTAPVREGSHERASRRAPPRRMCNLPTERVTAPAG
jgi:transposase